MYVYVYVCLLVRASPYTHTQHTRTHAHTCSKSLGREFLCFFQSLGREFFRFFHFTRLLLCHRHGLCVCASCVWVSMSRTYEHMSTQLNQTQHSPHPSTPRLTHLPSSHLFLDPFLGQLYLRCMCVCACVTNVCTFVYVAYTRGSHEHVAHSANSLPHTYLLLFLLLEHGGYLLCFLPCSLFFLKAALCVCMAGSISKTCHGVLVGRGSSSWSVTSAR